MSKVKTYKVTYRAPSGEVCSYLFKSSLRFVVVFNPRTQRFALDRDFARGLAERGKELARRAGSIVNRNGGFDPSMVMFVECLDTGVIKFFQECTAEEMMCDD